MAVVQLNCPLCQGAFQVDDSLSGQNVACPLCHGYVTLPPMAPAGAGAGVYSPGGGFAPSFDPTLLPPGAEPALPSFGPPSFGPKSPAIGPASFAPAPSFAPTSSFTPPSSYAPPGQDLLPPGMGGATPGMLAAAGAPLQLGCPVCTGMFQVTPDMAGLHLACPHCGNGVTIPALWGGTAPPYSPGLQAAAPAIPPGGPPQAEPPSGNETYRPQNMLPPGAGAKIAEARSPQLNPPGKETFRPQDMLPPTAAPAPKSEPKQQFYPPGKETPRPQDMLPPGRAEKPAESPWQQFYPPGMSPQGEARLSSPAAPQAEEPHERAVANNLLPPAISPSSSPSTPQGVPPAPSLLPPETAGSRPTPETRPKPPEPSAPTITRRPGPALESILPPGAGAGIEALMPPGMGTGGGVSSLLPPAPGSTSGVESLLPPGAAPAHADGLLPPGVAAASTPVPVQQVALPTPQPAVSPEKKTRKSPRRSGEPSILIPTDDGGFIAVQEPVKTVEVDGEEVELKKLTPEEKAKRRLVRNLIVGGFCLAVLAVTLVTLVYFRG